MRIKKGKYGARVDRVTAAVMVVVIVKEVMDEMDLDYELTSQLEGEHMPGSLHFVGLAWDWTVRSSIIVPSVGLALRDTLKKRLADDFDVVWKKNKKQLHIEFQPKRSLGKL